MTIDNGHRDKSESKRGLTKSSAYDRSPMKTAACKCSICHRQTLLGHSWAAFGQASGGTRFITGTASRDLKCPEPSMGSAPSEHTGLTRRIVRAVLHKAFTFGVPRHLPAG